ncbi:MAG: alcohol dehydrogenase catalytic domain-containing protein [Acutalibacteraceae bacterium]|jgi:ribitol-5-phosphate 2-dehydrogenase
MLNTVYQLKRPRQFEAVFQDIACDDQHVLVRPTHLSICNADQRYYQGTRAEAVLRQKLPMALIHEGIGKVIFDPTGTFEVGQRVVMIPNLPVEEDDVVAENYRRSSKFRGSGTDGFLQEMVLTEPDRLVPLPEGINLSVAAFTEIVSVSYHAISRFDAIAHRRRRVIGVWGDGNLGYITSLLLKKRMPEARICVFGVIPEKLADFTFVDETYLVTDMPDDLVLDHAFECVGGAASSKAINQIIDHIQPEGTISILGVSEDLAPINTRMVLEKGLRIFGSSRSGRADFVGLIELYRQHPEIVGYFENIVGSELVVRDIRDIAAAFETDIHKLIGKTVMIWEE